MPRQKTEEISIRKLKQVISAATQTPVTYSPYTEIKSTSTTHTTTQFHPYAEIKPSSIPHTEVKSISTTY